jgi:hypothetical protein
MIALGFEAVVKKQAEIASAEVARQEKQDRAAQISLIREQNAENRANAAAQNAALDAQRLISLATASAEKLHALELARRIETARLANLVATRATLDEVSRSTNAIKAMDVSITLDTSRGYPGDGTDIAAFRSMARSLEGVDRSDVCDIPECLIVVDNNRELRVEQDAAHYPVAGSPLRSLVDGVRFELSIMSSESAARKLFDGVVSQGTDYGLGRQVEDARQLHMQKILNGSPTLNFDVKTGVVRASYHFSIPVSRLGRGGGVVSVSDIHTSYMVVKLSWDRDLQGALGAVEILANGHFWQLSKFTERKVDWLGDVYYYLGKPELVGRGY